MSFGLLDDAVGVAIRRCPTPHDLSVVTDVGDEPGACAAGDTVWDLVEEVYRSGMHPGIQVCVRHRGEVVLERAIGQARGVSPGRRFDPGRAVPLTVRTPINLFSAAKAVTGMAMHKLAELGDLSLDDAVARHVPGFERHGKGEITIRQVLSHRAGLSALPSAAFDLDLLTDPEAIERIICEMRPGVVPSPAPEYHAVTGGFVMEAVARHAAGRSLRDVLATEVKEPLGLRHFDYGVAPDLVDDVATNVETGAPLGPVVGFFMQRVLGKPWGEVLAMSNDPRFLQGVIPSANVIVTARDVTAFYQCVMNGGVLDGTRVFTAETVADSLEPTHHGMVMDRVLGVPMRYASGFMLGTETFSLFGWDCPRAFGHVGMSNLFTWADPDRDLAVALLTTGKPVFGPHLPALVKLIGGIAPAFDTAAVN